MSSERGDDIPRDVYEVEDSTPRVERPPVRTVSRRIYSDDAEAIAVARGIVEARVAAGDLTPLDVIERVRGGEVTLWSSGPS